MKRILLTAISLLVILSSFRSFLVFQKANAEILDPPIQDPIEKSIVVTLDNQTLMYMEGLQIIKELKISSGKKATPSPIGEFTVIEKKPLVNYIGADYSYPNTKWNLQFKYSPKGSFYIHGAYWHNKFGQPMSGGYINVSYADMEPLYTWADVGTKVSHRRNCRQAPERKCSDK